MGNETLRAAGVAELPAKEAIREVLHREPDARRRRDWPAARACYVAGASVDLGFDADRTREAQLERLAQALRGVAVSTLLASSCLIELGAGSARSATLLLAAHEPRPESGERTRLEALRAVDAWREDADGGWRIESRRLELVWGAWLDPRREDRAGDHRHAKGW